MALSTLSAEILTANKWLLISVLRGKGFAFHNLSYTCYDRNFSCNGPQCPDNL